MTQRFSIAGEPGLDPTLPDVELVFGGKTYHLCYDHNAVVMAEKATGINLMEAAFYVQSATALAGMLWASILRKHPEVTLEEVCTWVHPRTYQVLREALLACWFGSIPEATDDGPGEAQGETSPNVSPLPTSGPVVDTTSALRTKNSGGSRRGSSTSSRKGTKKR